MAQTLPPERNRKLLMAKALGFTNAISKLSREERGNNPSGNFGEDYNSLRASAAEHFPAVLPFLPPAVEVMPSTYGSMFTVEKYGEILAFCEQIFQLLSELGQEGA